MFTSDNGWMQGEHRIPGDKFLPYEESVRVPFIVRGPGVRANRTVRGQVSNIDFAPTLVDIARARAGRRMDGVSLTPTLRRSRKPRRAGDQARGATPALRGQHPDQRLGSALRGGADRALHLRGLHRDRRAGALRPAQRTRRSCATWRPPRHMPGSRRASRESSPGSTAAAAAAATSVREKHGLARVLTGLPVQRDLQVSRRLGAVGEVEEHVVAVLPGGDARSARAPRRSSRRAPPLHRLGPAAP